MDDRHSEPERAALVVGELEIAKKEAANALRQTDAAIYEIRRWLSSADYKLRPSVLMKLHQIALDMLSDYAGRYRPAGVMISGSNHVPPPAIEVAGLIEEFCDYINEGWQSKNSIHLAAYALWRLNWIHAFDDGNGCTSRIVSYIILCAHSGHLIPGNLTIPEQISRNKQPYYRALEIADEKFARNDMDLSEMENLLKGLLANQLLKFHQMASGDQNPLTSDIKGLAVDIGINKRIVQRGDIIQAKTLSRNWMSAGLVWVEAHPALVTAIATLAVAIAGGLWAVFKG